MHIMDYDTVALELLNIYFTHKKPCSKIKLRMRNMWSVKLPGSLDRPCGQPCQISAEFSISAGSREENPTKPASDRDDSLASIPFKSNKFPLLHRRQHAHHFPGERALFKAGNGAEFLTPSVFPVRNIRARSQSMFVFVSGE